VRDAARDVAALIGAAGLRVQPRPTSVASFAAFQCSRMPSLGVTAPNNDFGKK
jgi:hypothetical protein